MTEDLSVTHAHRPPRPPAPGLLEPEFAIEGPWNVGDPVHEAITLRALRRAGVVGAEVNFTDPPAWEFIRGVVWNDDPEGMLFDNNESETNNWSSGVQFGLSFKDHEKRAKQGVQFKQGSPLLARSHFGDLQFLHAMAARDGEIPAATLKASLEWAEFTYQVAVGGVPETALVKDVTAGRMSAWFPSEARSVRKFLLVGTKGEPRRRALGSLLHMVQDSFARGHAMRDASGAIVEFHSYIHQNGDAHKAEDVLVSGGLDAMPGALKAVEACVRVLELWKQTRPWAEVKKVLEQEILRVSPNARPASPGPFA